jgi:hypothetical protein
MSIVHEQKECRKQARQSGVAAMARNILTPGYCETPVMARSNDSMLISRNREEGLVIRVKQNGQYCTVFQLYRGSIKKFHETIPGVDWLCLLKQWSDETSLENNFTCETEC